MPYHALQKREINRSDFMNKKHTLKKVSALALGLTLTIGATGCNFFPMDSEADLKRDVAIVEIYDELKTNDEYKNSAEGLKAIIDEGYLSNNVTKRELVAYFLNMGSTYVNNYGYTYKQTVETLMDSLVNREIMIQYAIAYYLGSENITSDACIAYVNAQKTAEGLSETEKTLLAAHPEVLTFKYFLTDGNSSEADAAEDYDRAVYQLKSSFNSSLDSLETSIITETDEEHDHATARTTPTGVDTAKEDYYPTEYEVYTGRNTLDSCGDYEKQDGSTAVTRQKAYNAFLANLQSYGLIKTTDKSTENTSDITKIDYYYVELSSALGQALINKYFEDLQEDAIGLVDREYVEGEYKDLLEAQQLSYSASVSNFETALDKLSDNSFVLNGAKDFGFVYNILIPFSKSQEQAYSAAKNKGLSEDDLYIARRNILENVKAKDLRDTWFSEHDHANYSYEAAAEDNYFDNGADKGGKNYLFFENNVKNEKGQYEPLKQYAGQYPFNGTVDFENDKYVANTMSIDGFISEMENYIDHVVGSDVTKIGSKNPSYTSNEYVNKDTDKVNYQNFMYYAGVVEGVKDVPAKDYFKKDSLSYKVVSAINELMFAYSTDTGCLNTYMGYAVSPYKTKFVPEFEFAAQYAIKYGGVGSYVVCATDYGWHILYVSFVYGDGEVYGTDGNGFNWDERETEGTFSNMFYESLKSTAASTYTNEVQSNVLNKYNNDDCVELITKHYKNLLELDEQA